MTSFIFINGKFRGISLLFLMLVGTQCLCQTTCLNNGINITIGGSNNIPPYPVPSSTTVCVPNAAFTGPGFWTGAGTTGIVTYTFSPAVMSATISYSAVNATFATDVGAITIDGGGTLSIANPCGVAVAGNVLTCNLAGTPGTNIFGDVTLTVDSTLPFTTITLTNTGGNSGWVCGNPCNFILCPATLTLVSPGNNVAGGTANNQAGQTISATNLINASARAVYHAGDFVELNAGFEADFATEFAAFVAGCDGLYPYKPAPVNQQQTFSESKGNPHNPAVWDAIKYLRIHPNPASTLIKVEAVNAILNRVRIISIDGKVVFDANIDNPEAEIDVSGFESGIYVMDVASSIGQFSEKFIKN